MPTGAGCERISSRSMRHPNRHCPARGTNRADRITAKRNYPPRVRRHRHGLRACSCSDGGCLGPAPDEHAVGMGFQVNYGMDSGKPSVKASKTPGSAGRRFIGKASTAQPTGWLQGGPSAVAKVRPWWGVAGLWEVQQLVAGVEGNHRLNLHSNTSEGLTNGQRNSARRHPEGRAV